MRWPVASRLVTLSHLLSSTCEDMYQGIAITHRDLEIHIKRREHRSLFPTLPADYTAITWKWNLKPQLGATQLIGIDFKVGRETIYLLNEPSYGIIISMHKNRGKYVSDKQGGNTSPINKEENTSPKAKRFITSLAQILGRIVSPEAKRFITSLAQILGRIVSPE